MSSPSAKGSLGSAIAHEPARSDPDAEVLWIRPSGRALSVTLCSVAYFASGWLALQTHQPESEITLLWPPPGIAIFMLARFGRGTWPAIAVASMALNLQIGSPLVSAVVITIGNVSGPLLAVHLMSRRLPPRPYDGVFGSMRVVAIIVGSMVVPAIFGPTSRILGGLMEWPRLGEAIVVWWAGYALGAVLVGSLLLSYRPSTARALRTPQGLALYALSVGGVGLASALAFYGEGILSFVFATLLVLAVVSVREPRFTSASAVLVGALVAIVATTQGMGPFARDSIHAAMPIALSYVTILLALQIVVQGMVADRRALTEAEQEKRRLLEATPDSIMLVGLDGRIVDANDRACQSFGCRRRELVGRLASDFDQTGTPEIVAGLVRRVLDEGEFTFETEHLDAAGQPYPVEIHVSPYRVGDVECAVAVSRDISDRKEAERRLHQKQRVEALGSLAGGIAHDLNNTLSPVLLSVDALYERLGANDPLVATVEKSAERAVDMIRHLLGFARGAEGTRDDVDPFELLDELDRIVTATFPKTLDFEIEAPDALPMLRADATQLHQVFVNLCVNARDAMPEGGTIHLRVTTTQVGPGEMDREEGPAIANPGRFVVFEVEDSGPGIPEAIRPRIFEPFFSTKPANEGTGLGLASASGIVGNHGGAIHVGRSEAGGARFRVYLPALEREAHAPEEPERHAVEAVLSDSGALAVGGHAPPSEAGDARRASSSGPERGRVLLVDDEASIREVAEQALRRFGFEVYAAGDAHEALALFDRVAPLDAVVSDLRMPGMSGEALIEALRERAPGLPAVLTSGYMGDAERVSGTRVDAPEVVRLNKPYRIRALRKALDRALGETLPKEG
ncbi:MAG: ATP-binding protein [bacterium]|nr:ATP-binding protein [bacterium]